MIAPGTRPRKCARIAARVVDGKALIVVIDHKQLHTLNEVGTRVWELCDGGRTVQAIADAITSEFDVDGATALHDVERFVEQLSALGALELEAA